MTLTSRLLGANPSIQVSTLLSGSLTTPSAKSAFVPNSYESISTTALSTDTASITFSSIPATYTHLQIRCIARIDQANTDDNVYLRFNGDTGANYAGHYLFADGSTTTAAAAASQNQGVASRTTGANSSASIFGVGICDILDYANTNKYKTARVLTGHDQNGSGLIFLMSTLWQSSSAVTSITLFALTGNMKQYSHFALYGIKA